MPYDFAMMPQFKQLEKHLQFLLNKCERSFTRDKQAFALYISYLISTSPSSSFVLITGVPAGLSKLLTNPDLYWLNLEGEDSQLQIEQKRQIIQLALAVYLEKYSAPTRFKTARKVNAWSKTMIENFTSKLNNIDMDIFNHNMGFCRDPAPVEEDALEMVKPIFNLDQAPAGSLLIGGVPGLAISDLLIHSYLEILFEAMNIKTDDLTPSERRVKKTLASVMMVIGTILFHSGLSRVINQFFNYLSNHALPQGVSIEKFIDTCCKHDILKDFYPINHSDAHRIWSLPSAFDNLSHQGIDLLRIFVQRELYPTLEELGVQQFCKLMVCSLEIIPPNFVDKTYTNGLHLLTHPREWIRNAHTDNDKNLLPIIQQYIKIAIIETIKEACNNSERTPGLNKAELFRYLDIKQQQAVDAISDIPLNAIRTIQPWRQLYPKSHLIYLGITAISSSLIMHSIALKAHARKNNVEVDYGYILNTVDKLLMTFAHIRPSTALSLLTVIPILYQRVQARYDWHLPDIKALFTSYWQSNLPSSSISFFTTKVFNGNPELDRLFNDEPSEILLQSN